jgi:hypothetical protein
MLPPPNAAPRPREPKLGACQACRLSKVKCDLEIRDSGTCGRCERIGLLCAKLPLRRGGGAAHAGRTSDALRLRPEFREQAPPVEYTLSHMQPQSDALRSMHYGSLVSQMGAALPSVEGLPEATQQLLVPQVLAQLEGNRHAQAMLMRQYLSIARRSNNAQAMGQGLLLAAQLNLGVDDVLRFDTMPTQPGSEAMPDFLGEWFESGRLCLSRHVSDGHMYFDANAAMKENAHLYGDLERDKLLGTAEFMRLPIMRALTHDAATRTVISQLFSGVLLQAGCAASSSTRTVAMHHCQAEGSAPVMLSCPNGETARFKLSMRLCSKDRGSWIWSVLWFDPIAEHDEATSRTPALIRTQTQLSEEEAAADDSAESVEALAPAKRSRFITKSDLDVLLDQSLLDDDGAILNSLLDIGIDVTKLGLATLLLPPSP